MEKKRNSYPLGACKKFFKAITVCSAFRSTIRHNSDHHQYSTSTNPSPNPLAKTHHSAEHTKPIESAQQHKTSKNGEVAEGIPIKFDDSGRPSATPHVTAQKRRKEPISELAQAKHEQKGDKTPPSPTDAAVGYGFQGELKTNSKIEPPRVSRIESNKAGANMNDKFADYINRTGIKIRTTSSVNTSSVKGKNNPSASGDDDKKDHFSDYINRAKKKMLRTMSNFGGRKDSMK